MRFIERNGERGVSDLGWLLSRFTYSFADYANPKRMGFGVLRVVNDDTIAPQSGFPLHHHEQMEIVTIMLEGVLTHHDTLGNKAELKKDEVQAMTAGTGVSHGEWNNEKDTATKLLQVWIYPRERALTPGYTQTQFPANERRNTFQILASGTKKERTLFIHQDATFARATIESGKTISYTLQNPAHGVFVFVIAGRVKLGEDTLGTRDAMEVTEEPVLSFVAEEDADVLVIEVPLS